MEPHEEPISFSLILSQQIIQLNIFNNIYLLRFPMTVDQFLEQFKDLDPVAQRIKIFEAVRDFPYQIK